MNMNDLEQKSNQLNWLKAIGVDYYCSEAPPPLLATPNIPNAKPKETTNMPKSQLPDNNPAKASLPAALTDNVLVARQLADSATSLTELQQIVMNFDGCALKKLANNTVFADGNAKAKIMLIGEAPGASEDMQGIPFCGESGKLLDNMLTCIGISRQNNAYITNTIFWRPPGNRSPTEEEINICRPFVEKHIALIQPKLIILVGSTAATSLLGKHAGITKIRQEYYSYTNKYLSQPIQTTALFHPAYLLRQPLQKKTTWYDLIKIQQFLSHPN